MTYVFSGFFSTADETLLRDALRRWPRCRGRLIKSPFVGFGVSCPANASTADEEEANEALVKDIRVKLRDWSLQYPDAHFVWFDVECFGGNCLYWGFACQDGEMIIVEANKAEDASKRALLRLLSYLGVEQRDTYFEPFTRGYFDGDPA